MSAADARVIQLVAEVERDWRAVEAHLERARSVQPRSGAPEAALVALSLDHAYQAFETLLLRVERALGLPERTGAAWHSDLLDAASLGLTGLRPALYAEAATTHWRALLKFRHFLRHAYHVELDADELARNVAHLERAVEATKAHVEALLDALRE